MSNHELLNNNDNDSDTDDIDTPQSKTDYSPTLSANSPNVFSKRSGRTTVKRDKHNQLEKVRRHQQRNLLNKLKDIIPGLQTDKLSTAAIIQKAMDYILALRCINAEQAQMIIFLQKKNPNMMLPGPVMMPPTMNGPPPMSNDPNVNNLTMLNPGMYPGPMAPMAPMNPLMMYNPMAMNLMLKNQAIEMEKIRRESERHAKQKEVGNEGKHESSIGQVPSQRSSGSDGVPQLPSNEMEWSSRASIDTTSMVGFDPNAMYPPRKRRSIADQDFDSMMKTYNERRDSFAAMFEPSIRHSDPNFVPMNPYRESIAALYNYGFYNPEDKGSVS